jgi:hypothetical protein
MVQRSAEMKKDEIYERMVRITQQCSQRRILMRTNLWKNNYKKEVMIEKEENNIFNLMRG